MQQVPHQAAPHQHRQFQLEAAQHPQLQALQQAAQHGREQHPAEERAQPLLRPLAHDGIDKDLGEDRERQTGHQHQDAGAATIHERPYRPLQARGEGVQHTRVAATRGKGGPRFHDQHDPREGAVELLERDGARPPGRIIQINPVMAKALDHHKVVKIPKDD